MQRVAIGRALVRRPEGDADGRADRRARRQAPRGHAHRAEAPAPRERRSTTVYVTHDQVEAMSLADRIAIMNEGVLQQVGTPSEVYLHPVNLFVAQFVGSPVMNIAPVAVKTEAGRVSVVSATAPTPSSSRRTCSEARRRPNANGELTLGIRPEGVIVSARRAAGYIPVEAHIIEPLGAYDIVDLKIGARCCAPAPRPATSRAGRPRLGEARRGADAFLLDPLRRVAPHPFREPG
jgi:multiple sugar transport system ATP-binding protein